MVDGRCVAGRCVDGRCVRAVDGALDRTALGVHAIGLDARGRIDQGVHSLSAVGRSVDRADQRVDGHVVGPVDRDESVSDRSSLPLPSSDEYWRGDYSVLLNVIMIKYDGDVAAFSCCTCSREARSERRQNSPPPSPTTVLPPPIGIIGGIFARIKRRERIVWSIIND